MKLVTVMLLGLLSASVGWRYYAEHRTASAGRHELATIATLVDEGRGREAFGRCERLRQGVRDAALVQASDPVCEFAALARLRQVAASEAPDLVEAQALIAHVLAGANTGAEIETEGIAASLPGRFLESIRTELTAGELDRVQRGLEALRGLYSADAATLRAAVILEHEWARAEATSAFRDSDIDRLLAVAASVTEQAPLDLQAQVASLVRSAIVEAVETLGRSADYARAFRLLTDAERVVRSRPDLERTVAAVQSDFLGRVFGESLPVALGALPPALRVVPVGSPAAGKVSVTNRSRTPLRLRFRGPESRDVSVGPDAIESIPLPAGEYLVFASAEGSEAALGTVAISTGYEHQQVLELVSTRAKSLGGGKRRNGKRPAV